MLSGFRSLAEAGPLAASSSEFSERVDSLLKQLLQLVECRRGTLLMWDGALSRFRAVSQVDFEESALLSRPLNAAEFKRWAEAEGCIAFADDLTALRGDDVPPLLSEVAHGFTGWTFVVPLRVAGNLVGAALLTGRPHTDGCSTSDLEMLESCASIISLAVQNQSLSESLRVQVQDNVRLLNAVDKAYCDSLEAICLAIDAKDSYLAGHSKRVAATSVRIAEALGMPHADVVNLRAAAQLHDIGKVTVDRSILVKTTVLRPEEFREIADHTVVGHRIIQSVRLPWAQTGEVVRWHHERIDGSGYPDRLHSTDLPLHARIVAIADSYDAMISERPYRKARSVLSAVEEIAAMAPMKFDADAAQALFATLKADGRELGFNAEESRRLDMLSHDLLTRVTGFKVYSA